MGQPSRPAEPPGAVVWTARGPAPAQQDNQLSESPRKANGDALPLQDASGGPGGREHSRAGGTGAAPPRPARARRPPACSAGRNHHGNLQRPGLHGPRRDHRGARPPRRQGPGAPSNRSASSRPAQLTPCVRPSLTGRPAVREKGRTEPLPGPGSGQTPTHTHTSESGHTLIPDSLKFQKPSKSHQAFDSPCGT